MNRVDGLHQDVSFREYLANKERYGSSDVRTFRVGPPSMVPWSQANPRADTDATILGTAAHAKTLTPDLFDQDYAIIPSDAPRKPDGRILNAKRRSAESEDRVVWWRDFDRANAGKVYLRYDDVPVLQAIRAAVLAKPVVKDSLEGAAVVEASAYWTDPLSGLPCKGRPDWFNQDEGAVYDLKVSRYAASPSTLHFRIGDWVAQLAYNRFGLRTLGIQVDIGRLVVVAPTPPHTVVLVEVKDEAMNLYHDRNVETMGQMEECRATGVWPGTESTWVPMEPPPWEQQRILEQLSENQQHNNETVETVED